MKSILYAIYKYSEHGPYFKEIYKLQFHINGGYTGQIWTKIKSAWQLLA